MHYLLYPGVVLLGLYLPLFYAKSFVHYHGFSFVYYESFILHSFIVHMQHIISFLENTKL